MIQEGVIHFIQPPDDKGNQFCKYCHTLIHKRNLTLGSYSPISPGLVSVTLKDDFSVDKIYSVSKLLEKDVYCVKWKKYYLGQPVKFTYNNINYTGNVTKENYRLGLKWWVRIALEPEGQAFVPIEYIKD